VDSFSGADVRLLRLSHRLRQADVGRAMIPPVGRSRVVALERRPRLSLEQFRRLAAAVMAAAREGAA